MTQPNRSAEPVQLGDGWRRLLWYGSLCVLATAGMAALMTQQRGVVMGILAGIAFGVLTLPSAVSSIRTNAWYRRHPVLHGVIFAVTLFIVSALFPDQSLIRSAATAVLAGVFFGLVMFVLRRRQQP
jgi:membrane associated rhomboid family serine protease